MPVWFMIVCVAGAVAAIANLGMDIATNEIMYRMFRAEHKETPYCDCCGDCEER